MYAYDTPLLITNDTANSLYNTAKTALSTTSYYCRRNYLEKRTQPIFNKKKDSSSDLPDIIAQNDTRFIGRVIPNKVHDKDLSWNLHFDNVYKKLALEP